MKNGMTEDEFVDKYLRLCEESGRCIGWNPCERLTVSTITPSSGNLLALHQSITYSSKQTPRWLEIKLDDGLIYERRKALLEAENVATKHTLDFEEREGE